ncbi:unnamed protein product [Adineta ricciae]|uniref:Peptidase M13 N-terminal domain-containing protein n=1 Tax=Adineta ricciae TaxID=249248 RepID=A0A813YN78_ADIRI|nr:unnamed protein product [Adineta ricciae]
MSSSSSSSSLFHCLICILCGFCLAFILILTTVIIYNMNSRNVSFTSKSHSNHDIVPIARKRQLQDFVNVNIDPCENFYDFVCDKWTQERKRDKYHDDLDDEDTSKHQWTRIRHQIHDKLMINITTDQSKSNQNNVSATVLTLYQLCETQPPSSLLDEVERYFALLIQQEPYRSYSTLFNQTPAIESPTPPVYFQYNPFFKLTPSSLNHLNHSFTNIHRINYRSLPSPLLVLPNSNVLNQTALADLITFDHDYQTFLQEANETVQFYEQEYNQNSLIIKRIFLFADYHLCLSSLNETSGLKNLIQLLNYFLQTRLHKFNTRMVDKQIRILDKITNNHTLVEHLRRIRLEFKLLEEIIPLEDQSNDDNCSCIIHLLDQLLDRRMTISDLSPNIDFFSENSTLKYYMSNDWPYIMMLYDRLLKPAPLHILVNFVFFDYYRHLIYPYYQPHIHRSIEYKNESLTQTNLSCSINNCFDILNCYHPSLMIQTLVEQSQISVESIRIIVENLINRFRLIIEQSDHLYMQEKTVLIDQLNQIKVSIGHPSLSLTTLPSLHSLSYLDYVQLFASMSSDHQAYLYSTEPIYNPMNHTLILPYGFIYLSNHSIEYPLVKFLLKLLSQTIQSNPFYIECLIKSFDDSNSTTVDTNDEHITYLLFRTSFLYDHKIIFDEYLWPFMSANSLIKRFLIDYTANNYCQNSNAYQLFLNNTYLYDDISLVFHCSQASSIKQSKCSVI